MKKEKNIRTERIDEKCSICKKVLFTREITIDETMDKNGAKLNDMINEKIIKRKEYGIIVDNIRNDTFYLCMDHFKQVWEVFRERNNIFRNIIYEIKCLSEGQ